MDGIISSCAFYFNASPAREDGPKSPVLVGLLA